MRAMRDAVAVVEVAVLSVDSEEEEVALKVKRTSEAVEEAPEVLVVPESPVAVLLRTARPPRLLPPKEPLRPLTEHF